MSDFTIEDIPDDLFERLRRRAAEEGRTVEDLALRLIERELSLFPDDPALGKPPNGLE